MVLWAFAVATGATLPDHWNVLFNVLARCLGQFWEVRIVVFGRWQFSTILNVYSHWLALVIEDLEILDGDHIFAVPVVTYLIVI